MKFRMLTNEELAHFENDLKAFLIIHGIDGDLWAKINTTEPDKAIALVGLFSDQILETVYEKIQYLEHRSKDRLLIFHFGKDSQQLIAIQTQDPQIDLSSPESIHHALKNNLSSLEFFRSERAYNQERAIEMHQLLEQGSVPSTASFWNALNEVL